MKKIFLLLIFSVFSFSNSLTPANGCCGDGTWSSWQQTSFNSDPIDFSSREAVTSWVYETGAGVDYCEAYGHKARRSYWTVNDSQGIFQGFLERQYIANCNPPTCPDGEEFVDGYCVPITPTCPAGQELNDDSVCVLPLTCPSGQQIVENLADEEPTSCSVLLDGGTGECTEIVPWNSPTGQPQAFCLGVVVPTDTNDTTPSDTSDTTSTDTNETTPTDTNDTTGSDSSSGSDSSTDTNDTTLPTDSNTSLTSEAILSDIKEEIKSASNQAHSDHITANSKYDDIIIGLRDVIQANNEIGEQAEADAQTNHEDLEDIKDALGNDEEEAESESTVEDAQARNSELEALGETAIQTYTEGFSSISDMFNNIDTPTITPTGSCDLSANIFNGTVLDFKKGFNDSLPILKPFVMFIFNISLTILLIRWAVLAWQDVVNFSTKLFGSRN